MVINKQAEPQAADADTVHAAAGDADPAASAGGGDSAQSRQSELKQKAANVTALVCVDVLAWLCAQLMYVCAAKEGPPPAGI